jgi:phage terminase small subunit
MPPLKNPKHELFAQARYLDGLTSDQAYVKAGYKRNDANAARLNGNERIQARGAELLAEREIRLHNKFEVTKERILAEYAKIGFADLRKAVRWHGALITEEDNPDGGDVLVIKNIYANAVELVSSDDLDEETAAAIAEVSQTQNGVKIKLHDKKGALDSMAKHLNMFVEKHEHSGPGGKPIEISRIERVIIDPKSGK